MANDITDVVAKRWVEILQKNKLPDTYYGIFWCGTIVKFDKPQEDVNFVGFGNDVYDFPSHRLKNSSPDIVINESIKIYNNIIRDSPEYINHINTVYNMLIKDGYPYPGTEGSDKIYKKYDDKNGCVEFINRNPDIINLVFPEMFNVPDNKDIPENIYIQFGSDHRRTDYIQPTLASLITPTLDIIKLYK